MGRTFIIEERFDMLDEFAQQAWPQTLVRDYGDEGRNTLDRTAK